MKQKCPKYTTQYPKKSKLFNFVCFKVNLVFVIKDIWWVDFGVTTHVTPGILDQNIVWTSLVNSFYS